MRRRHRRHRLPGRETFLSKGIFGARRREKSGAPGAGTGGYGASGTGKTSLIQCGLASKFQNHKWTPLYIRRSANLNDSLEKVLEKAGSLIDAAMDSGANLAVIPLQDFLGLDERARMNRPGHPDGNWRWQFQWSDLDPALAPAIKDRVASAGRLRHV